MMEVRPSSEQGVMPGREPFGLPKSPPTPPSSGGPPQSLRMAFTTDGTPVFAPVNSAPPATATYQPFGGAAATSLAGAGGNGGAPVHPPGGAGEPVAKKKRGRPRKYGPDGSMSLALVHTSMAAAPGSAAPGASGPFSPEGAKTPSTAPSASPDGAKKRGRPKGSTNKKHVPALGSAGAGFTPHVIFVKAGEDVSAKIMSFSQHGTRAVCILSANGAISNVTLRQSATSGGTVTYEGRFEILSLSGSFLLSENGGHRSRTGGLSVSLAGPDGRVLGGSVAGLLTAASPVQIVAGSFNTDGKKEPPKQQQQQQLAASPSDPSPAPLKVTPAAPSSPPSRGTMSLSESSGGPPSPPHGGASGGGSHGQQQSGGFSGLSWK